MAIKDRIAGARNEVNGLENTEGTVVVQKYWNE